MERIKSPVVNRNKQTGFFKSPDKIISQKQNTSRKHEDFQSPKQKKNTVDTDWLKEVTRLNDTLLATALEYDRYDEALDLLECIQNALEGHYKQNQTLNKKIMYWQLFACYSNFAMVYQAQQKLELCSEYLDKAMKSYQQLQGYILGKEENLNYILDFVQLQLPFCNVLSQAFKHDQAISYAERSLIKLSQCFRVLQAICNEQLSRSYDAETASNSRDSNCKSERVDFKEFVISEAEKLLAELTDLPSPHKLASPKYRQHFESIIQKMYFWKANEGNNEATIKKELNLNKKPKADGSRNILGLQKQPAKSVDNCSIANVMILKQKKFKEILNLDPFYLLSKQRISYMVFLASLCYFTIATETRFSLNMEIGKTKIVDSYGKQAKDEKIARCKVLHLKALELAGKHIQPSSEYFNHLLSSFHYNYRVMMEQIHEEEESVSHQDEIYEKQDKENHEECSPMMQSMNIKVVNSLKGSMRKKRMISTEKSKSRSKREGSRTKALK